MSKVLNCLYRSMKLKVLTCTYSNSLLHSYSKVCLTQRKLLSNKRYLLLAKQLTTTQSNMSTEKAIKVIDFQGIKSLENNEKVILIDVREPAELQNTGVLPGSINIPLGEIENILKNLSPEDFQKRYNRPKPDHDFPLVFSCASGKRSLKASEAALHLGYKNVSNYSGGWSDWEKNVKASN